MKTNHDRLNYLREKIKNLSKDIIDKELQGAYMVLLDQITNGKTDFKPISEDDWSIMLPKEQDKNFLLYYHTFRAELQGMKDEIKKLGPAARVTKWLTNPWTPIIIGGVNIIQLGIWVAEQIISSGLFFHEEDHDLFD